MHPNDYPRNLPDKHIEDEMQQFEAAWILGELEPGSRVLDLGYGSGIIARALVAAGHRVTVVDGAPFEVEGATCVVSMFENFEPDTKYDAVIASFILEHVDDPVALLKRARQWTEKLIVVCGNAASIHRRLAVKMGLQPSLFTLSARDIAVGHHRVYDIVELMSELGDAGWTVRKTKGLFMKPLPNSMMTGYSVALLRAMNEIELPVEFMANVGMVCE